MVDVHAPAFVVERRAGLHDFWAVYDNLSERLQETAIEVAVTADRVRLHE